MCLAVPGRIAEILDAGSLVARRGKVDFGGIFKEVNLCFVPEARQGDYVIVHVGFALGRVDAAEAERTLEYFKEIGDEIPG